MTSSSRPPDLPAAGDTLSGVLVPNLGQRYSGVTSVIKTTLPHLQRRVDAELVGLAAGAMRPPRSFWRLLRAGFSPPPDRPFRIWHARRNVEMVAGLLLRDGLRWPLRLVFSSAAQRRHTRFTDWLIARMDAVIATTRQAAAVLNRPSVLIPHGIDGDLFAPVPDRAAAWTAHGLGGRYGIGVFGRVRHNKGTDLFVAALIELLPRYPDFSAVVVGLCKPSESAFLADLKAKVAAAGLERRLVFAGEVPPGTLPSWLASVSICVGPQRQEGFGLVPLEAAACATPVVATRVGAAELIVEDGETGLLVEPNDRTALSTAIERLMADPGLRDTMGRAARRRAIERFGIEREVDGYLGVYRSLWAGQNGTEPLEPASFEKRSPPDDALT